MRRFWDRATIEPTASGFRVLLDGKPMHLPGGLRLDLASRPLAEAVAAEWQEAGGGKGGEMSFENVPLSRLAGTAQERIAPHGTVTAAALARYGETDLLCYRADTPPALVALQQAEWQPWLDWAEQRFGAHLRVATGVMPVTQDTSSLAAFGAALGVLDPNTLAGLGVAVPALGSLVLGLALAEAALDAAEAHRLATLDERFQEEFWGADEEAVARRARLGADVALAARFIALARN